MLVIVWMIVMSSCAAGQAGLVVMRMIVVRLGGGVYRGFAGRGFMVVLVGTMSVGMIVAHRAAMGVLLVHLDVPWLTAMHGAIIVA